MLTDVPAAGKPIGGILTDWYRSVQSSKDGDGLVSEPTMDPLVVWLMKGGHVKAQVCAGGA